MSKKYLSTLLLSALILTQSEPIRAQPLPKNGPGRPSPEARPADQDMVTVDGAVQKYLINPRGQIDGLLLSENKQLHFPPHLSPLVAQFVKVGDKVEASCEPGLASSYGQEFRVISLKNSKTGQSLLDEPADITPTLLTAKGKVSSWLVGHMGDVRGLLLADGSQINCKPHIQAALNQIKLGDTVSVQGYGTRSPLGTCIEAESIDANGNIAQ